MRARINPKTAITLTWLAAALLVVGGMIPAPLGSAAAAGLAALVAVIPLVLGTRWVRIAAGIVLLAAFAFALSTYREAGAELDRYTREARER